MQTDEKSYKFGTFGGVFTPSILTILGVIMYLRLPYIVGQAGLWMALGIILVAHTISVTTGLSVASIATDKKIKTGGIYYIISRSLGLPIGGTIGIALFIGMSFGTSLYLIGFAESMLQYVGLPVSLENIRIAASLALAGLATITLISTNLAIKIQYLILLAIIASLASIFGFAFTSEPRQPHLLALPNAPDFGSLFGIFFPAVTGFTAGVAMSGDLKDPKRAIPLGTILAILAGLFVYTALSGFLALFVPGQTLATEPGILEKISISPELLAAGIWGATLSSALGSMLGAPRILQATSQDHITPSLLGRAFGQAAEPRIALLLSLGIAEAGVLIGELDLIARIVSVFFIMSYAFINSSCFIESWVSPDFRPEFRIPSAVSLLGLLTCIVVMIQLDLLAMIAASLLMGLLFAYLTRKQLVLESGDTWEGVWSSVVRYGLHNLNRGNSHERNWRPNMILFSGGADARPELVSLARALSHKRGIVSNFELVETKKARLQPRHQEALRDEDEGGFTGIFNRRIECRDIYATMENIARYYGISGAEPNTVLMGQARSLRRAKRFAALVASLSELDYNILLFDQSKTPAKNSINNTKKTKKTKKENDLKKQVSQREFLSRQRALFASLFKKAASKNEKNTSPKTRQVQHFWTLRSTQNHYRNSSKKKTIDIWWSGQGNNLGLALALLRFLETTDEWRNSLHRLLAITPLLKNSKALKFTMETLLEESRMQGQVSIIHNEGNARPFKEIILQESQKSDLVFLGMPDFTREEPAVAVKRMNEFARELNYILWVRASSYFRNTELQNPPKS